MTHGSVNELEKTTTKPAKDGVHADGVRDHVPALIVEIWHPDGDDWSAKCIDEYRLKPTTRLAMLGWTKR
jgi:hypothetical protein